MRKHIWTGFVFAIAGGVGLMASQRPSYSMVTAFMVLSIIASIFALILIVVSGIGMGFRYSYRSRSSSRFLFGMELLIGLAEGIVAITTAAFCCRVTCISPHRQNTESRSREKIFLFAKVLFVSKPEVSEMEIIG